ncbi:MAG: aldo/keto reductase [Kiritimatiellaeota bacterium]|nr:aldo/keto reductase [Kiritimatiellota bacterium]
MIYRTLGKTGLKVSQLGFGGMRFPMAGEGEAARCDRPKSFEMLEAALAGGVNYFDTAVFYNNFDSQRLMGEFFKGRRKEVVISTKNHCYSEKPEEWEKLLDQSLELLQTDYIDIYNHHGIGWKSYTEIVEPKLSKLMMKARDEGKIRHICCSFHDTPEALMKIIDTGYPEVLTIQYNMLDRKLEEAIAKAHEKNIGIVVMGPVAGGRLGAQNPVFASMLPQLQRVPELALRFVLANPGVTVALSGMSSLEQVKENVVIASDPATLSETDRAAIDEHLERLKKMKDLYCSGCGYCKPCPQNVDIPAIFDLYNNGRVYGFWDASKGWYKGHCDKKTDASQCTECGACTEKCPQKIDIPNELKKAAAALT